MWSLWPPGTLWLSGMGAGGREYEGPELCPPMDTCVSHVCVCMCVCVHITPRPRFLDAMWTSGEGKQGSRACRDERKPLSKLMKTEKLLTHEGDLSLMSSPHGEVATLAQNNKRENVFSFSLYSNL